MPTESADLEFGLVWDEDERGFDVSLRFTDADGADHIEHPQEPLRLDLAALDRLATDVDGYAEALTAMVFGIAKIRVFYERSIARAATVPVHFRVHASGPSRFHRVRWELLREPGDEGRPVAATPNVLFSRYLSSEDWRPVPVRADRDGTAREGIALVVVAGPSDADDYGLAAIDVSAEVARAREAVADYRTVVLAADGTATLDALVEHLDGDHDVEVLYLVAHGALTEDVPVLYLEAADGRADPVDARRLVERVYAATRKPTLAMLLSCQSATVPMTGPTTGPMTGPTTGPTGTPDDGPLAALGPRLAGAGIPAVVAMQGAVTVDTARAFTSRFFEAFRDDPVVDRAVARGRMAVYDRRDWWMPVLFSRLRTGRTTFKPPVARDAKTWDKIGDYLQTRRLTPVLGPGLADDVIGSRSEIARRWVRRWQMPITLRDQGNLTQVAQYLRVGRTPGEVRTYLEKYLFDDLRERRETARPEDALARVPAEVFAAGNAVRVIDEIGRLNREADPDDPYRITASLPLSVFFTTGYTDLLQHAMQDRDPAKKPRTFCFPWRGRSPEWIDSEGIEVEDWEPPTPQRPWVCHLFGRLAEPESLVLTEDDYFEWFSTWISERKSLPKSLSDLRAALTKHSLLFLGHQLGDWDFRVVFQSIRSYPGNAADQLRDNPHIGVQLRPESAAIEPEAARRYLESYFDDDKLSITWSDTKPFLVEMRDRFELGDRAEVAP